MTVTVSRNKREKAKGQNYGGVTQASKPQLIPASP